MTLPDPVLTSLGAVLMALGYVSQEDLELAVLEQRTASRETLLGKILVANGVLTREELQEALKFQRGIRSKKPHERAVYVATMAANGFKATAEAAQTLKLKAEHVKRKSSGSGHPAITDDMLAKKEKK